MKRAWVAAASLLASAVGGAGAAGGVGHAAGVAGRGGATVDADVRAAMTAAGADGSVSVVVHMSGGDALARVSGRTREERRTATLRALRDTSDTTQRGLRARLSTLRRDGAVETYTPMWVTNGIAITATPAVIEELAARPDVASITSDVVDVVPTGTPSAPPEPNIAQIGAPTVWQTGHDGEGVLVAVLDTGVDVAHPDLSARWRGGANAWFDPYGQHATPFDPTGHGTAVTGAVLGGGSAGTTIGVAPGASFIAARVFDDSGRATASAIHAALQWALDPDGNPATADAPQIVNASWAYGTVGCNLEFQPDVQALRAAGIVPVFAAGNAGPGSGTDVSPANYPESLAVGAVNASNGIWSSSSRGPSACGGGHLFPSVVAPGVDIWTTDRNGLYSYWSGTSLAAPAVTGALALLISAGSGSGAEAALLSTAVDLGTAGSDDVYGRGRIDVAAASGVTPPPTTAATTTTTTTTTTLPPTTTTTVPPTTTTTSTSTSTSTSTTTTSTTTSTTTAPPPVALFADGFESGSTSAWTSGTTNGGRLNVATTAALRGQYGVRAQIANTNAMYVADATPSAEATYRVRLAFDPNTVSMSSGRRHDLVRVLTGAGATAAVIQLQRSTAGYQVRAGWLTSSGTTSFGTWSTITDAPHDIDLAWAAATTAGGTNGTVTLAIDGVVQSATTGVKNGTVRVESLRVGPQGLSTGITGTELFDDVWTSR